MVFSVGKTSDLCTSAEALVVSSTQHGTGAVTQNVTGGTAAASATRESVTSPLCELGGFSLHKTSYTSSLAQTRARTRWYSFLQQHRLCGV